MRFTLDPPVTATTQPTTVVVRGPGIATQADLVPTQGQLDFDQLDVWLLGLNNGQLDLEFQIGAVTYTGSLFVSSVASSGFELVHIAPPPVLPEALQPAGAEVPGGTAEPTKRR